MSPGWVSPVSFVLNVVWNWAWQYINAVQIFFVAGCIGTYHFDRTKAIASLPLQMLKIAFTTSFGTLAKVRCGDTERIPFVITMAPRLET